MTLAETAVSVAFAAGALGGWLLYFGERARSRDYVTDLLQVVHDHDLGRDDLRRSLDWREVEAQVERWENAEPPACEECDAPATCSLSDPAVGPRPYCRDCCPRCGVGR